MIQQENQVAHFPRLTEEQRRNARQRARNTVLEEVGDRPLWDHYKRHTVGSYPPYVMVIVTGVMLALLCAAFVPSAYRVFSISSEKFSYAVDNPDAARQVGYAFILLAESGQIGFMLAAGVLSIDRAAERRLLYLAAAISTAIALVFNVQKALGDRWLVAFWQDTAAWLEAYGPPILVIFSATVLKYVMLEGVRNRHANKAAYERALAEWLTANRNPEQSREWVTIYANALWDEYREAHGRKNLVKDGVTSRQRYLLVLREMEADNWFEAMEDAVESYDLGEKVTDYGNADRHTTITPRDGHVTPVTVVTDDWASDANPMRPPQYRHSQNGNGRVSEHP